MQKLRWAVVVLVMLCLLMPFTLGASANETVVADDKIIVFQIGFKHYLIDDHSGQIQSVEMDAVPYIKNGRTYVPVRFLANALGVTDDRIGWDPNAKKATLKGDKTLVLTAGSRTMLSDGQAVQMDVAPEIVYPGRTMLPARYVAEGLGYSVTWDPTNRLVICTKGNRQIDLQAVLKKIQELKPATPPPGKVVWSSAELKELAKWFESKGYKVRLRDPGDPNCINNYGAIQVVTRKSAPNKQQFDADVYQAALKFVGKDGAEWVKKILDAVEDPDVHICNRAQGFGNKALAVVLMEADYDPTTNKMVPSDELYVDFSVDPPMK